MPFYLLIKNFTEKNVLVDDIISIIFIDNSRFYLKDTILADNFYFEKGRGIHCFLRYALPLSPVSALYRPAPYHLDFLKSIAKDMI